MMHIKKFIKNTLVINLIYFSQLLFSFEEISPKEHILKEIGDYYTSSGYTNIDEKIFQTERIIARFHGNILIFEDTSYFYVKSKKDIETLLTIIDIQIISIRLYKQLNFGGLKVDRSQMIQKKPKNGYQRLVSFLTRPIF